MWFPAFAKKSAPACFAISSQTADLDRMSSEIWSPPPPADQRIAYGSDECQFCDLRLPREQGLHPVAIVVHGGFWRAKYGLEYIAHTCAAFAATGIATWNIE